MATPKRVLSAIEKRDGGRVCAWPDHHPCDPETVVPQHRQGGMGGGNSKHRLSNVIWLCSRINGLIEDKSDWAEVARKFGVKVKLGQDTTQIKVTYPDGITYLLDDNGGRHAEHETGNE